MRAAWNTALIFAVLSTLTAAPVRAQDARPRPIVEAVIGHAEIGDNGSSHAVFGGGARLFVTSGIAIGPELLYMRGPKRDRDVLLTGTATFDLRADSQGDRSRRVVPYIVANGGVTWVSGVESIPRGKPAVTGAVLSVGGGARIAMGRFFIGPEYRIGLEPQMRFCVWVGWRPGD